MALRKWSKFKIIEMQAQNTPRFHVSGGNKPSRVVDLHPILLSSHNQHEREIVCHLTQKRSNWNGSKEIACTVGGVILTLIIKYLANSDA